MAAYSRWTVSQLAHLLTQMETYSRENKLHSDEVIALIEGPAAITLTDIGWDEREVYGTHTSETPKPVDITV